MKIVLASSSQRRKRLLAKICGEFEICHPPEAPAHMKLAKNVREKTRELAKFKAVWGSLKNPSKTIVGADTLVQAGDKILGKQKNSKEASKTLRMLSSKSCKVITSVCIAKFIAGKKIRTRLFSQPASLKFKKISSREIENYAKSGLWEGKAAGFNIEEEPVCFWIGKIRGEKDTIIGLPIKKLKIEIEKFEK